MELYVYLWVWEWEERWRNAMGTDARCVWRIHAGWTEQRTEQFFSFGNVFCEFAYSTGAFVLFGFMIHMVCLVMVPVCHPKLQSAMHRPIRYHGRKKTVSKGAIYIHHVQRYCICKSYLINRISSTVSLSKLTSLNFFFRTLLCRSLSRSTARPVDIHATYMALRPGTNTSLVSRTHNHNHNPTAHTPFSFVNKSSSTNHIYLPHMHLHLHYTLHFMPYTCHIPSETHLINHLSFSLPLPVSLYGVFSNLPHPFSRHTYPISPFALLLSSPL